jgi:hypothetical protein
MRDNLRPLNGFLDSYQWAIIHLLITPVSRNLPLKTNRFRITVMQEISQEQLYMLFVSGIAVDTEMKARNTWLKPAIIC